MIFLKPSLRAQKGRISAHISIRIYTSGGKIKTKEEFLWHLYRAKESGADGVLLYHYPDCLRYFDIQYEKGGL